MTDAQVSFEIQRKDSKDDHLILNATENIDDEYILIPDSSLLGEYSLIIHVKKKHLHFQQEESHKI